MARKTIDQEDWVPQFPTLHLQGSRQIDWEMRLKYTPRGPRDMHASDYILPSGYSRMPSDDYWGPGMTLRFVDRVLKSGECK